ncbi:dTDP-4-dehydrorhamnose 3,5-epimerase [bacterium]|nr:MAG: dTDP-4-dehydrorhamnose 3,5-epimerase [bacterium]
MTLKCTPMEIPEVILVEPRVFPDVRGHFLEVYHQEKYFSAGIRARFVQDNFSSSVKNTLRGLHYQSKRPQAKLVSAIQGHIFDVAVDIRPHSPTFGKWVGAYLSGEDRRQLFIPEGFAHGFCVLSDFAAVLYKCSDYYDPDDDRGVLWSDPQIAIPWPVQRPVLSEKDARLPLL